MSTILLFVAGYFGFLAILAVAALPYRRRIRRLGTELLCLNLNERESQYIEGIMMHAYSIRSAIVMLLDYVAGMLEASETTERQIKELEAEFPLLLSDYRTFEIGEAFFVSALAANPLVGVFTIFARLAFRVKLSLRLQRGGRQAQELVDLRGMSAI